MVELGLAGTSPVSVRLLKENSAWVIDEISLRQPDGVVFHVRQNLRREIAQRFLDNPDGRIMQAVSRSTPDNPSGIVHAFGESQTPRRGNLTLPSNGNPKARTAMLPPGIDMTPAPKQRPAEIDGIMKFGPGAANETPQNVPMSRSAASPEAEETLNFNAEKTDESKLTESVPRRIRDISQHPIEITTE